MSFKVYDLYLNKAGKKTSIHDTAVAASVWHHEEGLEKPKQTLPPPAKPPMEKAALPFIQKGNSLVPRIPYAILKLMNTTPRDFLEKSSKKMKGTGREKPSGRNRLRWKVDGRERKRNYAKPQREPRTLSMETFKS